MNRQMKRMQQRQGKNAPERQAAAATARRSATQEKKKRTPARQFLKEVRQELRKVDWPTREETVQTTIVVLIVAIIGGVIFFALDFFLGWVVTRITGQGSF